MRAWAGAIVAIACVLAWTAPARAWDEPRLALLIGNEDYAPSVGALSRPHEDVAALDAALRAVGFETTVVLDADEDAMEAALADFAAALGVAGEGAAGLFYYAGHGASAVVGGSRRNYLIPAREEVSDAASLAVHGVEEADVVDILASAGASAMFVVIDACRNELETAFSRGGDRGFDPIPARPGLFIAHATFPGATAPDDGAFATELARQLTAPGLYAERAFALAYRAVAVSRAGYQLPTAAAALREDFCFHSCPAETPIDAATLETAYFGAAETCADFRAYAARFPDGAFIELAENRVETLCAADDGAPAPSTAERADALTRFLAQVDTLDPDFTTLDALHEIIANYGFDALTLASANGDPIASTVLGTAYEHGVEAPQNYEIAARHLRAGCDGGFLIGCHDLGVFYRDGRGVAQSDDEAARLFRQVCDGGDGSGCGQLGWLYEYGRGVATAPGEAARLYGVACEDGFHFFCVGLGWLRLQGVGVERNVAEAARLFTLACEAGEEALACASLGNLHEEGLGVARDLARAQELYERACADDNAYGCESLGHLYNDGLAGDYGDVVPGATEEDAAEAERLFARACEIGVEDGSGAAGCLNAGLLSAREGEAEAAEDFLARACEGDAAGHICHEIGERLQTGRALAQDETAALGYLRGGCARGYGLSCNRLGAAVADGRGTEADLAEAARLFARACEGGVAGACGNLGLAYEHGRGLVRNDDEAVRYYRMSCAGDHLRGCGLLARMHERGRGGVEDLARARELYERACAGGEAPACEGLERLDAR